MRRADLSSDGWDAVALACRWPRPTGAVLAPLRGPGVDWEAVIAVAERHRILGFVAATAIGGDIRDTLPDGLAARLAEVARANAVRGLAKAAEEIRVDRALRERGLSPLFVKGASLAQLAYQSLALKSSADVDVLVAPGERAAGGDALRALGYELAGCGSHEEKWRDARNGAIVELHFAVSDYPWLLAGVGIDSPRQRVALPSGAAIETLSTPLLFAYLGVHGAMHGWERLKWLVDFAALTAGSDLPPEELLARAETIGAGRAARSALLLAHRVLALPLPGDLAARLGRDRDAVRSARFAVGRMAAVSRASDGYARGVRHELALHVHQICLSRGWRHRATALGSTLAVVRWPFQRDRPPAQRAVLAVVALPFMLVRRWWRLRRGLRRRGG